VTVSPAQRAQRRNAGKKSGKVRAGHAGESTPLPDRPLGAPFVAKSSNAEVAERMATFVATVGEPMSWPDVKNYVQTEAEIYKTLGVAQQFEIDAGRILTREQVRARDERAAQIFRTELQTINQQLTALVPADRLLAAQSAMREWIDGLLNKVADAIEGEK